MPVNPLAVNPSILAFKPRQLLLSISNSNSNSNMKNNKSDLLNLKEDQKALVVASIARYLENNGFTKTLKKFRSEAEIEKDYSNSSSPALEEVFCKYFLASDNGAIHNQSGASEVDAKPKKTKKGENKSEPEEKSKKKNKLDSESLVNDDVEDKQEIPSEANGKKSKDLDSKELSESGTGAPVEDKKVKSKIKKKKKDDSENLSMMEKQGKLDDEPKPDKKGGKSSKKRKREASEENENQNVDLKAVEANLSVENTEGVGKENNGNFEAVENGNDEKSREKSTKKQKYDSADPQTKRFQRVKVEEVEFADERLQDNSYWSKDGAENGYGAKAQEILGQVKGRGFRHEKTKKKRGSYRGGQIDLQSHSIKFQNSDDDE